jgi:hypothetical protein
LARLSRSLTSSSTPRAHHRLRLLLVTFGQTATRIPLAAGSPLVMSSPYGRAQRTDQPGGAIRRSYSATLRIAERCPARACGLGRPIAQRGRPRAVDRQRHSLRQFGARLESGVGQRPVHVRGQLALVGDEGEVGGTARVVDLDHGVDGDSKTLGFRQSVQDSPRGHDQKPPPSRTCPTSP